MNKKSYIFFFIIVVLNIAVFYYYFTKKQALEKEKEDLKSDLIAWQKKHRDISIQLEDIKIKYTNTLNQLEDVKIKLKGFKAENKSLSQKIHLLEKEKQDLTYEIEQLRSPVYLADIVTDRIRLKLEVKALKEKLKARDETVSSLIKDKKNLQMLLTKEQQLSQKLTISMAQEKKKGYSLSREIMQKAALIAERDTKIDRLGESQLILKDKIKGLKEIIEKKDKEIKDLKERLDGASGKNKLLEDKLAQLKEEKELLEEELSETKRLYKEAMSKNESLSEKLLKASEKVVSLDEKLEELELALSKKEEEKRDLEEKYKKLFEEKKMAQKDTSFTVELTKTITAPRPNTIEGKILASSSKYNFVIINIGEEDGINPGDRFYIYRDNKEIGEIEVTRIRANSSLANIVSVVEGVELMRKDIVKMKEGGN